MITRISLPLVCGLLVWPLKEIVSIEVVPPSLNLKSSLWYEMGTLFLAYLPSEGTSIVCKCPLLMNSLV